MDRPVALTLIAIVNICYGAISFCGMSLGVAQFVAMQSGLIDYGVQIPEDALRMSFLEIVQSLFGFIVSFGLSTALIVSGVGLLGAKPWARSISVLYAIVTPIILIVQHVISFFAINMNRSEMEEIMGGGMSQTQMDMGITMMFVMMLFMLATNIVHCVAVYTIMKLDSVEAWFSAANWSGEGEPAA